MPKKSTTFQLPAHFATLGHRARIMAKRALYREMYLAARKR